MEAPAEIDLLDEVVRGLAGEPRSLPCKLFYDETGARLFEQICETEAYYPTRTELAIMRVHAVEMADALGRGCRIVELGSGSGVKTRILLGALHEPAEYLPIDISGSQLQAFAAELRTEFPGLAVRPVAADYTQTLELPEPEQPHDSTAVYFPGSTIGNFLPPEAVQFLARIRMLVGADGRLLIGVDLRKDPERLELAYNDPEGITAAFNLNILAHVNRACGADFDLEGFTHRAFYDERLGRIEMQLVSRRGQTVTVAGEHRFHLLAGEPIVTEYSCKYALEEFAELASSAGFRVDRVWTDPEHLFSVQLLRAI